MDGFTYNGIHCSAYDVGYAPKADVRWWDDPSFETEKKEIAWRHGGYWYGTTVNIREIKLECYFEEITMATREKIRKWLGRTTSGKLVFDQRPFVYYNVRPESIVQGNLYNDRDKYSGTFTVTFMATDPFGYLTRKANTSSDDDDASDYCGIVGVADMPAPPMPSSTTFDVYNPGTENCGLTIRLAGSCSNAIRFYNSRNNTSCIISALPSNGIILDLNGDTGMVSVYTSGSSTRENGFAYHDRGMVRLEPCETIDAVSYDAVQNGTTYTVTPSGVPVTKDLVGGRIRFATPSTKTGTIQSVNETNGTLTCVVTGSGTLEEHGTMKLQSMNHITIQEKNDNGNWVTPTTLSLTSIAIDYSPRLL